MKYPTSKQNVSYGVLEESPRGKKIQKLLKGKKAAISRGPPTGNFPRTFPYGKQRSRVYTPRRSCPGKLRGVCDVQQNFCILPLWVAICPGG